MQKLSRIIAFFLCFSVLIIQAQSRKELENKRKKTEQQIALTQKILKETKNKKTQSIKELTAIARLIEKREELISDLNQEIIYVGGDIESKKIEIVVDSKSTDLKSVIISNFDASFLIKENNKNISVDNYPL
jgi:ferritin-like metal-binding protein YciE